MSEEIGMKKEDYYYWRNKLREGEKEEKEVGYTDICIITITTFRSSIRKRRWYNKKEGYK